jgi:isopenicillin N synthase-like dioxygenase
MSGHSIKPNTPKSAHTAFTELPVVDVSGLSSESRTDRQKAARALDQAARDAGFLYVTGHGIDPEVIAGLQQCACQYFTQDMAAKMTNYIGLSQNHSGYVPAGEERFYSSPNQVDKKEAYDIGFECTDPQKQKPMLGTNQWPDLPDFQEGVTAYYQQAMTLGEKLFRGFALGLGLPEDTFTRHLHAPPNQLRLLHYPYDDSAVDTPGIGAHTDYEFFTILLPTAPGLEVLNGAGQWIDAPFMEGALVINIGDMIEVFTNGAYVATSHRVRKVAEERYSFPLFCSLDYDTLVQPHEVFCSDQHTSQYEPLVCGDHLYAQTIQTFTYLKKRLEKGEIMLPEGCRGLDSFGQLSRVGH